MEAASEDARPKGSQRCGNENARADAFTAPLGVYPLCKEQWQSIAVVQRRVERATQSVVGMLPVIRVRWRTNDVPPFLAECPFLVRGTNN